MVFEKKPPELKFSNWVWKPLSGFLETEENFENLLLRGEFFCQISFDCIVYFSTLDLGLCLFLFAYGDRE